MKAQYFVRSHYHQDYELQALTTVGTRGRRSSPLPSLVQLRSRASGRLTLVTPLGFFLLGQFTFIRWLLRPQSGHRLEQECSPQPGTLPVVGYLLYVTLSKDSEQEQSHGHHTAWQGSFTSLGFSVYGVLLASGNFCQNRVDVHLFLPCLHCPPTPTPHFILRKRNHMGTESEHMGVRQNIQAERDGAAVPVCLSLLLVCRLLNVLFFVSSIFFLEAWLVFLASA